MRILHYSLGFPPYRTGGLSKFCMDLMQQQIAEGHDVALLWPGELKLWDHHIRVKYKGKVNKIQSFEIKNPLPVSYDEGIIDIDCYTKFGDITIYEKFLNHWHPDIIHIHTFMGLHKALLDAAKIYGIRTIFTAHDFFPICPKVTMFRDNHICTLVKNHSKCPDCNLTALSGWKRWILQHPIYRKTKNFYFVKKLRKRHRDVYLSGVVSKNLPKILSKNNVPEEYVRLRNYYQSLLKLVDCVHFNSSNTRTMYEKYLDLPKYRIISITHSNVMDNRKLKTFQEKFHFTYLGPQGKGKGFFLLKEALDRLWSTRQDFELNIFFDPMEASPYVHIHDKYSYDQLGGIFENTDVLIAPSLWMETFGYTVLEALSFAVPVIISGNVGAKDIIPEGAGIIINNITVDKLYNVLNKITFKDLQRMNRIICEQFDVLRMDKMSQQIRKLCYEEN